MVGLGRRRRTSEVEVEKMHEGGGSRKKECERVSQGDIEESSAERGTQEERKHERRATNESDSRQEAAAKRAKLLDRLEREKKLLLSATISDHS